MNADTSHINILQQSAKRIFQTCDDVSAKLIILINHIIILLVLNIKYDPIEGWRSEDHASGIQDNG